jgi:Protein of unknown function (DUF2934)
MKNRKNKVTEPQPQGGMRQQIELRAYQIWLANGCGHVNDLHHWFQAETEMATARPSTSPVDTSPDPTKLTEDKEGI